MSHPIGWMVSLQETIPYQGLESPWVGLNMDYYTYKYYEFYYIRTLPFEFIKKRQQCTLSAS